MSCNDAAPKPTFDATTEDLVGQAIADAREPWRHREGPYSLCKYGKKYAVRDFRKMGQIVFTSVDEAEARQEYERLERNFIARAAIDALDVLAQRRKSVQIVNESETEPLFVKRMDDVLAHLTHAIRWSTFKDDDRLRLMSIAARSVWNSDMSAAPRDGSKVLVLFASETRFALVCQWNLAEDQWFCDWDDQLVGYTAIAWTTIPRQEPPA